MQHGTKVGVATQGCRRAAGIVTYEKHGRDPESSILVYIYVEDSMACLTLMTYSPSSPPCHGRDFDIV